MRIHAATNLAVDLIRHDRFAEPGFVGLHAHHHDRFDGHGRDRVHGRGFHGIDGHHHHRRCGLDAYDGEWHGHGCRRSRRVCVDVGLYHDFRCGPAVSAGGDYGGHRHHHGWGHSLPGHFGYGLTWPGHTACCGYHIPAMPHHGYHLSPIHEANIFAPEFNVVIGLPRTPATGLATMVAGSLLDVMA